MNVVELLGLPALEEQLKRLEPLLVESVVTGDGFLDEVTTHLLAAGGKRLRPVLALATATSGRGDATEEEDGTRVEGNTKPSFTVALGAAVRRLPRRSTAWTSTI